MLKKLFIMLLPSLFCHMLAEGAQTQAQPQPQKVAVVKSSTLSPFGTPFDTPFDTVVAEFKRSCQCRVTEHNLTEDEGQVILDNIRRTRPEAVFVVGAEAFTLVREITDIPVIYSMVMNPLDSPGDNKIGISMEIAPEKQLEELRNVIPNKKRVGLVYDPRRTALLAGSAMKAADKIGIKLISKEVYSPKKVLASISGLKNENAVDVIWLIADPTVVTQETLEFLLLFSLENNMPILTFSEKYVRLGALMSLSPDPVEVGRKTGAIARRILAGEDIRDIKPDSVDRTVLSLNLSAAKKLGIPISSHIINRAYIVNRDSKNR